MVVACVQNQGLPAVPREGGGGETALGQNVEAAGEGEKEQSEEDGFPGSFQIASPVQGMRDGVIIARPRGELQSGKGAKSFPLFPQHDDL